MIPNFSNVLQGRDPQFHKLWCIGLDNITHEVHMTAQLEVGDGTMGGFTTNYLAENGRRIPIIEKLYINGSIQFLGTPDFSGEMDCRLLKT